MLTVGVRELKQHLSDLLRQVREGGQEIQIIYRGEVVAPMVPIKHAPHDESGDAWATLDTLAAEIGARWPKDVAEARA